MKLLSKIMNNTKNADEIARHLIGKKLRFNEAQKIYFNARDDYGKAENDYYACEEEALRELEINTGYYVSWGGQNYRVECLKGGYQAPEINIEKVPV